MKWCYAQSSGVMMRCIYVLWYVTMYLSYWKEMLEEMYLRHSIQIANEDLN